MSDHLLSRALIGERTVRFIADTEHPETITIDRLLYGPSGLAALVGRRLRGWDRENKPAYVDVVIPWHAVLAVES